MKRDMDLVRQIVLAMEDAPTGFAPEPLEIDGYNDEQIGYHVYIMMDGGLLVGASITSLASSSPRGKPLHLTWAGHEFAAASRDNNRWRRAMELVGKKAGAVTIDVLGNLLSSLASDALFESEEPVGAD